MTWDSALKIIQTIVAGCLVAMIVDYVRFRYKTARDVITRADCAACRDHVRETDRRLFQKVDDLKTDVGDVRQAVGLILGRLGVRGGRA